MRPIVFVAFFSVLALAACDPDETASGGGSPGGGGAGVGGAGGGGSPPSGLIPGNVARYDYKFDAGALTADTLLTIDVAPPGGDCVDLESLVPVTAPVTWNGETALLATTENGVFHACGTGLSEGALAVGAKTALPVKTYYGLDVGYSVTKNLAGGDFSYLLSWVGGCDSFGPCDDNPGTVAEMHFEITHPSGLPVLCPGKLTAGDTVTRCDIEGTLAPTYSGVAWASDPLWQKKPFGSIGGVSWVFYEVPGGQLADSLDPATMTDFFAWLTSLLGPFPYGDELRFAGGPTAWLGFEHPANIVLYEDLAGLVTDYADTLTHVTMHEIVHQWAGDRVTIASSSDFVWKEAMAEYLPYVYEDEKLGEAIGAASREYWDSVSLQAEHFPRPTDEPPPPVSTFYGDVYGPGPMVLFVQLEALIGREAVLSGIASFLKEPGARSVEELRAALEAASGKDLGPYFNAWVLGAGAPEWPTLKVETSEAAGEVTVTVTQQNATGKLYGCVVEVDVTSATQTVTALVDFGLDPQSAQATTKITLSEPVVDTALDPRHKLIARESVAPLVAPPHRPVWIF